MNISQLVRQFGRQRVLNLTKVFQTLPRLDLNNCL